MYDCQAECMESNWFFRLQRSLQVRPKTRGVRLVMGMKHRTGRGCLGAGAAGHASDILSALSQIRACIALHD